MDPQLKSTLTSIGLAAATAVASWAASKGMIPGTDQATFANDLLAIASTCVAGLIAWYKARQLSQHAMIKAVNEADNGVKVVASSEPAKTVNAPLK